MHLYFHVVSLTCQRYGEVETHAICGDLTFLFIGYGMTEIGTIGLENPSMNKPGGFFPFPNFELKVCLFKSFAGLSISILNLFLVYQVIDVQTGAMLGPGEEGELCFRGPSIMKGARV